MVSLKNEAAKDVATFSSVESFSKSLPKTKAVLNQVVWIYTLLTLLFTKYIGTCELLVLHGILKMDEYMET